MFSKDPTIREKQVESALKNPRLTDRGRSVLLKMQKELEKSNKGISKKSKTDVANQHGVKVGDIFHRQIGYTNTFYQVTEIDGKSQIKVRELAKQEVENRGVVKEKPLKGEFVGRELTRKTIVPKWNANKVLIADKHMNGGHAEKIKFDSKKDLWDKD